MKLYTVKGLILGLALLYINHKSTQSIMKKQLFLGTFLFLGTSLFGQTLGAKPEKQKQAINAESGAKPLSEAAKTQKVNTARNQSYKVKSTTVKEVKFEKKKEDEK